MVSRYSKRGIESGFKRSEDDSLMRLAILIIYPVGQEKIGTQSKHESLHLFEPMEKAGNGHS